MKQAGIIKLFSIRGIEFKLHVSLFFLLAYIVLISVVQFPWVVLHSGVNPLILTGSRWLWSLFFGVSIFASIALHEFGHAIVAQALGAKVKGITLMMLGGVSEIEQIPNEHPYDEFKLAIVGPLVSLAIAAILYEIRIQALSTPLIFFSYWLGTANLVLGVFNLIPAFPMDGGRALRSILSAYQGKIKATQTSTQISKGFAWIFALWGILTFNLLLMLIAFFVYNAAKNEASYFLTQSLVTQLRVIDAITYVEPVNENATIRDTAALMLKTRNNVLPVQTVIGQSAIIHLSELKQISQNFWPLTQIKDIIQGTVTPVDIYDPISKILRNLITIPNQVLPVKSKGKIVGIIKQSTLNQILQFKTLEEVAILDQSKKSKPPAA